MEKILFVNACARSESRTLSLARMLLDRLEGEVCEVDLYKTAFSPLDAEGMKKRDEGAKNGFSDPVFDAPKQLSQADKIVIAAPYWDLSFPSVLKTYIENVTVSGITFRYSKEGRPESLCKAGTLYYLTTSGGFIGENDFGFSYVKAVAGGFLGISDIKRYSAEGLDIFGNDADAIVENTRKQILFDLGK